MVKYGLNHVVQLIEAKKAKVRLRGGIGVCIYVLVHVSAGG